MMSKLEAHYTNIDKSVSLVEFLHKLRIINSNLFMLSVITLHNRPHNLILGG